MVIGTQGTRSWPHDQGRRFRGHHLRPVSGDRFLCPLLAARQTLGAERFQKELLAQLAAAQRSAEQQRLVSWLGPASESYLRRLAETDRSLTRQVRELLLLVREYGPDAVAAALTQAHAAGAFGADYIANLLLQQRIRRDVQTPLRFQNPQLNELATDPLSLADYDSFILRSKKDSDDLTAIRSPSPAFHRTPLQALVEYVHPAIPPPRRLDAAIALLE